MSDQQAKSEEQQGFLNSIIDSLPLAMFCKDYQSGKGVFVSWNKTAESLWGLQRDQVIDKSDFDFFPIDQAEHFKEKDLETLRSNSLVFIAEEDVDSPSVGKRIVRTWKVPISGRYLLGISQDITDMKKMEQQLETQKMAAMQASKLASLGEMAGGIAHEINNPLAIIKGFAKIMVKELETEAPDKEKVLNKAEKVVETVDRVHTIVTGLRNFARDGSEDQFAEASLRRVVNDALDFCREKIQVHGVLLKVDVPDIGFWCQRTQLSQVILNLVNNAYTAVQDLDEKWIEVSAREEGGEIFIQVTDSGAGIKDQDTIDKLFEPFYTTKPIGQGTGLGLSISRGIVEKHSGTLGIDEDHEHTRFLIRIPKKQERLAS